MAVTNTGIVERNITGVNESDLWLDTEATSSVSNTGIVERSITGVHDANFVRPLGDELISNGSFDTDSDWAKVNSTVSGGKGNLIGDGVTSLLLQNILTNTKTYTATFTVSNYNSIGESNVINDIGDVLLPITSNGAFTFTFTQSIASPSFLFKARLGSIYSVDNVSVKEMLVNRESTATNTGIVERGVTGVNESDLWLDAESTSVVNNTGIVERPIVGVNESDEMFPDNTISNIVNIAGLISSLIADLKARATTFENEDATQEILINLQKC